MKKILFSIVVITILILGFSQAFDFSDCQEKMFTMTAYYSPQSGQIFYYKPTFWEEVILNGQWVYGASGKKVFNGMLAWPASYPFWSHIYFPWFGIWEIADRGGAIVLSGERWQSFDRIDVWMGNGEEGLIRALTFGKKNMTGYFCASDDSKTIKNALIWENVPTFKNFFDIALWIQQLEEGRNDIRTRTLQKYLVKLWYLNKKYRNGNYETHTKKALCSYQVARKIISAKNTDCGVFGKTTRYAMKIDVQNKKLLPDNLYTTGTFTAIKEFAKYYNGKPTKITTIQQWSTSIVQQDSKPRIFMFYTAYAKWQQSSEIKILQTFLQSQWLYSGALDGIYSKSTTNAVYDFQKKYNLIADTDPLILRGFLGPKTRLKINELRSS